jgi:hypothetical protein
MSESEPTQAEINDFIIAKLFVAERLVRSLLGLWVSAVASDQEVSARVHAIRSSTQAGIAGFPDSVRAKASYFLAEMLDQTEREIKQNRAAISRAPQEMQ